MTDLMADVVRVPVTAIHENPWNPNTVPAAIMAALVANIERTGFNQAVLVRPHPERKGEYQVVDGAHRFAAAKQLGMTEIPVIVRDLSDGEAKAQTLAMNKLRGEMDVEQVAALIREIEEDGVELGELLEFTGYSPEDVDGFYSVDAAADDEPDLSGLMNPVDGDRNDEGQAVRMPTVKWGRTGKPQGVEQVPMTDDEYEALNAALDSWRDEQGTVYGFVASILGAAA